MARTYNLRKRATDTAIHAEIDIESSVGKLETQPKYSSIWVVFLLTVISFIAGIIASSTLGFSQIPDSAAVREWQLKYRALHLRYRKSLETIKRVETKNGVESFGCIKNVTESQADIFPNPPKPKPIKIEKPSVARDKTPTTIMDILPSSDVWCSGENNHKRICHFKNLCYTKKHDKWFIIKTNRTIQEGFPLESRYSEPLLELSSIDNHAYFAWNYMEVSPFLPEFRNVTVRYEQLTHFMFKRLHPNNIMHNLHDDVLNLYFLMKDYVQKPSEPGKLPMPFSLYTHHLLLIDGFEGTASTRPFQYLSNNPIRFSSYLNTNETDLTCFRDAIVGNTDTTRWYQYGFFSEPQGPLSKLPNGMHVREVGEWIMSRMLLPLGFDEKYPVTPIEPINPPKQDNSHLDFIETDKIVILSRKGNRLILNEIELAAELTKYYGLETIFVRNEDHSFEEQIQLLRKARVVIGMHGSILVMAMFCRRGTVLIEMYPLYVPSEHYTPYKTMAQLNGMDLVYRAWEVKFFNKNTHEEKSIGHPNNHPLRGGLDHLSEEERQEVLNTKTVPRHICCQSPYWLYRIYQDTNVTINEIIDLVNDGLVESRTKVLPRIYRTNFYETSIALGPVGNLECVDTPKKENGTLILKWEGSWTGQTPDRWEILVNNDAKIFPTKENATTAVIFGYEQSTEIIWFVRPIKNDERGPWSEAGKCIV